MKRRLIEAILQLLEKIKVLGVCKKNGLDCKKRIGFETEKRRFVMVRLNQIINCNQSSIGDRFK